MKQLVLSTILKSEELTIIQVEAIKLLPHFKEKHFVKYQLHDQCYCTKNRGLVLYLEAFVMLSSYNFSCVLLKSIADVFS